MFQKVAPLEISSISENLLEELYIEFFSEL